MTDLVYYVIRQRGGWGVQHDGMVRSGHPTRDAAIREARTRAASTRSKGHLCRVRIQGEGGVWAEERSFAPPPLRFG